jgi:hypothetical protein
MILAACAASPSSTSSAARSPTTREISATASNVCAHGIQVVPCDGPLADDPMIEPTTTVPARTKGPPVR